MRMYRIVSLLAIIYFIVCLFHCHNHPHTRSCKILVFSWVIGPPFWFYFEYVALMGHFGRDKLGLEMPRTVEGFRYAQDLAAKLWVAMVVVLFFAAGLKP